MKADTGFRILILALVVLLGIGGYRQYQKRSRAAANPASAFAHYTCELHGGQEDESGYCFSCGLELAGVAAANVADSPPLKTSLVLGDTEASQFPHDERALEPYAESYQAQYKGTFDADPYQRTALRAPSSGQIREWFIEAMDYVQFGKKLGTFYSYEVSEAVSNYLNYAPYDSNDASSLDESDRTRLSDAKSRLSQLGITNLDPEKLREVLQQGHPITATGEGFAINPVEQYREVSAGTVLVELAPRSAFRVVAYFAESDLREMTIGKTVDLEFTTVPASTDDAARIAMENEMRRRVQQSRYYSSRSGPRNSANRYAPSSGPAAAPSSSAKFSGQIAFLGTVFIPVRNGYEVRITAEEWPHDLPMGATGVVQWGANRGTGLRVLPSSAIMETPRGPVAFKRVRERTYRPTPVTVGQVTPGGVEIRSGLQASDRVLGDVQWLSQLGEQRCNLLAAARAADE